MSGLLSSQGRHGAEILKADGWYYWCCACGARSGPPFYADATIASVEWAEHVKEAEAGR